ncbi:hypothetical protein NL676_028557 [Syzygium grande]|nr:hypothetical protein NL676_028557 [Syzygium grande]
MSSTCVILGFTGAGRPWIEVAGGMEVRWSWATLDGGRWGLSDAGLRGSPALGDAGKRVVGLRFRLATLVDADWGRRTQISPDLRSPALATPDGGSPALGDAGRRSPEVSTVAPARSTVVVARVYCERC